MKYSKDIKGKSEADLCKMIREGKKNLLQIRIDRRLRSAKATNVHSKKKLRRDIARMYTALRNK